MIQTTVLKPTQYAKARRSPGKIVEGVNYGPSPTGSSYWKSLFRCPREHALEHLAKLRPSRSKEALDVGWLVHAGLEAYYREIWNHQKTKAKAGDTSSEDFYFGGHAAGSHNAFDKVVEPLTEEPGYQETYEVVSRVLGAYFDHYYRHDRFRIIAVEETLIWDSSAMKYSARIDLIVEDARRKGMVVVEHKTARSLTADLLEGYQMDIQILGQCWLLNHCVDLDAYPPFRGICVNIATKHVRPQFTRVEVCPSNDHLAMFEESLTTWNTLRSTFARRGWPRSLGNCIGVTRGFGRCDYFEVCHSQPEATLAEIVSQDAPYGFIKNESEQ